MGDAMTYQPSGISYQLLVISFALSALCFLLFALTASAEDLNQGKNTEDTIYIVHESRYKPAGAADDSDIGVALCGTQCNALSSNYLNITEAGGWQLIRVANNIELTVELDNPFIGGDCVCLADEYRVEKDDRYSIENRRPRIRSRSAAGKP